MKWFFWHLCWKVPSISLVVYDNDFAISQKCKTKDIATQFIIESWSVIIYIGVIHKIWIQGCYNNDIKNKILKYKYIDEYKLKYTYKSIVIVNSKYNKFLQNNLVICLLLLGIEFCMFRYLSLYVEFRNHCMLNLISNKRSYNNNLIFKIRILEEWLLVNTHL